jgi:NADH:ubiquinone oxidoreductase subunit D
MFLTYNPRSEGDCHARYYEKMEEMRSTSKETVGLANRQKQLEEERLEMEALASIPKI